jgi:carboxypeptidase Taq
MTIEAETEADLTDTPGQYDSRQEAEHPCQAYITLKRKFRDIGRLDAIVEILGRDFLTAMPEGAYNSRLNQIAYLARRIHEDIISEETREALDSALNHAGSCRDEWDNWDYANLDHMQGVISEHCLLSQDVMEHLAKVANEGRRVHREALLDNDWDTAREHLREVVRVERELASRKMEAKGADSKYDALVRDNCSGFTLAQLETWFNQLETELKKLLPKIMERQAGRTPPMSLDAHYPVDNQMWLNRTMLELFGFDFERGGLYQTGHNPVEGGTPDDTRLVIKSVDTRNFMDSLKSALHEAGHGLYIQGLPRKTWRYQPVAKELGAAVHESQALLIEMMIGRTPEFFEFLAPRLEGLFNAMRDPSLSAGNLHKIKTWVKPTPDRKRADEVTYFFHVLVRFRLEKKLINGEMDVDDIPEAWTEMLHDLLGVLPQNHTESVLQDVHWYVGKFGYFPSYVVGHMLAAQLYETMQSDIPKLFTRIRRGDFKPITRWLNKNIHEQGRTKSPEALFREVTGADISPDFLIAHLESRYL